MPMQILLNAMALIVILAIVIGIHRYKKRIFLKPISQFKTLKNISLIKTISCSMSSIINQYIVFCLIENP
jgi:hypothetical protein